MENRSPTSSKRRETLKLKDMLHDVDRISLHSLINSSVAILADFDNSHAVVEYRGHDQDGDLRGKGNTVGFERTLPRVSFLPSQSNLQPRHNQDW